MYRDTFEPPRDKTNKMICAPSEDSDQPGHPPSLISLRMKKAWVLSYPLSAQRRLWSDWADAQADRSLQWAHSHFVDFVMSRLILEPSTQWKQPENHWSCIAHLSAEDMLKSGVIEEKKIKKTESEGFGPWSMNDLDPCYSQSFV